VLVFLAYVVAVAALAGLNELLLDRDDGSATPAAATRAGAAPSSGSVGLSPAPRSAVALDALKQRIVVCLAQQTGAYGFFLTVADRPTPGSVWSSVGDRADVSFKMASTFKLPVVLYLYTLAHQGKLHLTERVVYEAGFYQGGAGSLRYEDPGGSYTLSDLANRAIRQSDNVAQAMLVSRLGRQHVLDYMTSLGGAPVYQDGNPWDTPRDLVRYMRAAQDFSGEDADLGGRLASDLTHTESVDRIRAGTPAAVIVAHKIGNLLGTVNDVGLVKAPAGDYYLAMMSSGVPSDEAGAAVEQHVAQMVYEAIGE
jgi:beta-lactamase class A